MAAPFLGIPVKYSSFDILVAACFDIRGAPSVVAAIARQVSFTCL
jgi:hypothetical protein